MAATTNKKNVLGTVFQRGDIWATNYYDLDKNNKRKRRTKRGFASEADGYAFLVLKTEEILAKEAALHSYKEDRNVTVHDYLENWFEKIYSKKICNSTETTYRYTLYYHLLPILDREYPGIKLIEIKKEDINRIIRLVFKRKPSYGKKVKELFVPCMAMAKQDNLIIKNPARGLRVPHYDQKRFRPLNKHQMAAIIKTAEDTPTYLEILLALLMGLRKGEIYGLKFEDINFKKQTMHIRQQCCYEHEFDGMIRVSSKQIEKELKTENSERVLYIPDIIMKQIYIRKERVEWDKQHTKGNLPYEENGYVCGQRNGRARAGSCLNKALNTLTDHIGMNRISFHFLRHMTATILLYLKFDLTTISRILGHRRIKTTLKHYCADLEGDIEIVAIINKVIEEAFGGGDDNDEVRKARESISA